MALSHLWLLVCCQEPNEVALQGWGCGAVALQSRTEATQSLPSPILKWLGHRKLNLTLLTLGPLPHPASTSTHTTRHHLSTLTPNSLWQPQGWFTSSDMVNEDGREWKKSSRNLRSEIQRNILVVTSSYVPSLSYGVAADVKKSKRYSLSLSNLLTARGITTIGVLFWLLGSQLLFSIFPVASPQIKRK